MDDVPTLTAAELEALLARAEGPCAADPAAFWKPALAAVCRQALAQLAELEAMRNPQPPRTVPCPRCRGGHVCVGCEPGLCEFPCPGCSCTGRVKETS